MTVMVRESLDVERIISLENNINPSIVLKIRVSKRKCHMLVSNYRQWKGTSPMCTFNSRNDDDAISRFNCMTKIWENVVNTELEVTIIGDVNIDRLESNDTESRADLRNLIPILKKFQDDHNFTLLNKVSAMDRDPLC